MIPVLDDVFGQFEDSGGPRNLCRPAPAAPD